MENLTPKHMRCAPVHCPSVGRLDDGSLLIVGKRASMAAAIERVSVGEDEHAVIVDPALLDDVPRRWRAIDSAPKDGTRILLWWGYFDPYMAPGRWNRVVGEDETWEGWEDDTPHIPGNQECITHWQPLPLPPTEKVEA